MSYEQEAEDKGYKELRQPRRYIQKLRKVIEGEDRGDGGIKSRKFLFSVLVFVSANIFLATGMITEDSWAKVALGVIVAYLTGNVVDKMSRRRIPR